MIMMMMMTMTTTMTTTMMITNKKTFSAPHLVLQKRCTQSQNHNNTTIFNINTVNRNLNLYKIIHTRL